MLAESSTSPCSCTASSPAAAPVPSSAAADRPTPRGSNRASYTRLRPTTLDPSTGAVLVAARPPLVAFNVELAVPATLEDAQEIAALNQGGGPEGLRGPRDRPVAR